MHKSYGAVYWLTGLPGSGKSTLGQQLQAYLKEHKARACVYLDGDRIREVLGRQAHYRPAERLQLAYTYGRFCLMLAQQNLDVVCATVSLFHEVQAWNRQHLPRYYEICLQVPWEILQQRDQKQLYSQGATGQVKDVPGLDLKVEWPKAPDVLLINDGQRKLEQVFQELLEKLELQ